MKAIKLLPPCGPLVRSSTPLRAASLPIEPLFQPGSNRPRPKNGAAFTVIGSLSMPVPLPDLDHVRLTPPDAVEVQAIDCGVASAVSGSGGLTPLQQFLIEALFPAMTGHGVDLSLCSPMTAHEIAETLAARNLAFRTRGVQIMVLCALVLRPLPEQVVDQIARAAGELGVDEGVIEVFR